MTMKFWRRLKFACEPRSTEYWELVEHESLRIEHQPLEGQRVNDLQGVGKNH